jgi:hypothetical protein
MRRKRGSMGMVGLVALGVIFLAALMFVPDIFGHVESASNVSGTIYEAPYNAVQNVTFAMTTHGLPAAGIFLFVLAFIVAVGWLLWMYGR